MQKCEELPYLIDLDSWFLCEKVRHVCLLASVLFLQELQQYPTYTNKGRAKNKGDTHDAQVNHEDNKKETGFCYDILVVVEEVSKSAYTTV